MSRQINCLLVGKFRHPPSKKRKGQMKIKRHQSRLFANASFRMYCVSIVLNKSPSGKSTVYLIDLNLVTRLQSPDLKIVTSANGLRWVKPMFTLYRIAFGRHETIADRASLHTQKWLGGGGGDVYDETKLRHSD